VSGLALGRERVKEGVEHTHAARPLKPLPNRVPLVEPRRQSPPGDVVEGEVVQRFEELAVIPALVAPPGAAGPKQLESNSSVLLGHARQHHDLPS
jgi:hypothetical protein